MADDIILPIPNLDAPQHHFTLTQPSLTHLHSGALQSLFECIEKDGAYLYAFMTKSS